MDIIYCAGGNKRFAEIAINEGFLYGTRHDYKPYWKPFMVDINWKRYYWPDYARKIAEWQPVTAMVADYERPDQFNVMKIQSLELLALEVERPMVCPKFAGAVYDIPEWCVVAVSVPTSYAGYLPGIAELKGRRVHLLGGSPQAQIELIKYYSRMGIQVVSVDCNMHQKAAQLGTYFSGSKWKNMGAGKVSTDDAFRRSCKAILKAMRALDTQPQPPL